MSHIILSYAVCPLHYGLHNIVTLLSSSVDNVQCRGVLLLWIIVGQGPIPLAAGAGGGCLTFFLSSITSLFFLSLSGKRPDID